MKCLRRLSVAAAVVLLLVSGSASAVAEKSPYSYAVAMRAHNYCRATSCMSSSVLGWSCGSICTAVPGLHAYSIVQDTETDAFGFTGVDSTNKQIIVAFRGSSSVVSWIEDLTYKFTSYYSTSSCGSGCKVHEGFLEVYNSVRAQVTSAVTTLLSEFPDYQILATGHSLGGALAVLAAVDLQEQLKNSGRSSTFVSLYTLGAPRVGNPAFATWTGNLLAGGAHYRITHARDPVLHLPPMSFGFLHAPTEVFYKTDANSSMRVCADTTTAEDASCSDSMLSVVISDHLEYLGDSTGCSCTGCADASVEVSGEVSALETRGLPTSLYARLSWEYVKQNVRVLPGN